jgi:hypothetical protein
VEQQERQTQAVAVAVLDNQQVQSQVVKAAAE